MQWHRTAIKVGCVAALLALAGCATPGYSPTRVQSELVQAGATPKQAQCVTDGLSDTFDLGQLGSHSEPNAGTKKGTVDEFAKARAILKKCGVTLPLQPR